MRFHIGAFPEAPDFSPDATWTPLREPTTWGMQLYAFPLGALACVVVSVLWIILTPLKAVWFDSPGTALLAWGLSIPIHELIHAAVQPCAGRSANSVLGVWPSRLVFYAHYLGELSRARFIAILVMPLLIISFVPLIACAIGGLTSPFLAFMSILNAFSACGDMFAVGLLLYQVPPGAILRNQGWRTFWKLNDGAGLGT